MPLMYRRNKRALQVTKCKARATVCVSDSATAMSLSELVPFQNGDVFRTALRIIPLPTVVKTRALFESLVCPEVSQMRIII